MNNQSQLPNQKDSQQRRNGLIRLVFLALLVALLPTCCIADLALRVVTPWNDPFQDVGSVMGLDAYLPFQPQQGYAAFNPEMPDLQATELSRREAPPVELPGAIRVAPVVEIELPVSLVPTATPQLTVPTPTGVAGGVAQPSMTMTPSLVVETPTPTPTSTPTPTPTATHTPTIAAVSETVTPTLRLVATPTSNPTYTPTSLPSPTPTLAPTLTPSLTPTLTPSLAPTLTPSLTPSLTPTLPLIPTPTPMPTATPVPATSVPTNTPTNTPTTTPRIFFSPLTHATNEGDTGTTSLVFTVNLHIPTTSSVQVNFRTLDGSALVGDNDYQAQTGTLTFTPGQQSQTISIEVVGDTNIENNETFRVELYNPVGMELTAGQVIATGTILNDDNEETAGFTKTVTILGSTATETQVQYQVRISELSGLAGVTSVQVNDYLDPLFMVDDVTSSRGVDPDLRLVGNTVIWGGPSYLNASETLTIMITGRFAHPTGGCQPFYNPLVSLTVNTTNQTMTNIAPVYLDANGVCVP